MSDPEDEEPEAEPEEAPEEEDGEPGGSQLPAPIENILEYVPEEHRQQAMLQMRAYVARYSGPVPHASEMARYKQVDDSFPERFVRMAELQSEHRRGLETKGSQTTIN